MASEMLRDFLYLDRDAVTNYLSTLEGYIETEVDETESRGGKVGAEGGVAFLKGGGEANKSSSRSRKLMITDEAQFQRLYQLLDKVDGEGIPFIATADPETVQKLSRGQVIEVQANLKLPQIYQVMSVAAEIKPLADLFGSLGADIDMDANTNTAMQGLLALGKATNEKPLPLLFEPVVGRGYSFFCNLSRRYLRSEPNELIGEATVFGKVMRLIEKGTSEEVFTLLADIKSLPTISRQERRKLKNQKDGISERIKGPAAIIHPIAIFR